MTTSPLADAHAAAGFARRDASRWRATGMATEVVVESVVGQPRARTAPAKEPLVVLKGAESSRLALT